jgi:hypothetical protein
MAQLSPCFMPMQGQTLIDCARVLIPIPKAEEKKLEFPSSVGLVDNLEGKKPTHLLEGCGHNGEHDGHNHAGGRELGNGRAQRCQ